MSVIFSLSLQRNSTLLALRLSGNKIGNRGAMHLAGMLQVNNTLRELEVADCDLVNNNSFDFTSIFLKSAWLSEASVSDPASVPCRPLRV